MSSASSSQSRSDDRNEALAAEILVLLGKITERFEDGENEEWRWITQQSQNPLVVELIRDATATTLRVVDAIGRLEPVNGITIAEQFRIPRGTVSKITRRLLEKHLISSESLPQNKKEILFRLTPLGRELFQVHRSFDEQMERGFMRFLQRYSTAELSLLVHILQEASTASFLTLGALVPDTPSDA